MPRSPEAAPAVQGEITVLGRRMQAALDAGDWDALGRFDAELRSLVADLVAVERRTPGAVAGLREQLLQLLGTYGDLLADCRRRRADAAAGTRRVRTGRAAVACYRAA